MSKLMADACCGGDMHSHGWSQKRRISKDGRFLRTFSRIALRSSSDMDWPSAPLLRGVRLTLMMDISSKKACE